MTRKEKRKYKRDLSKTTDLSLIKEYIRLNEDTMGSVAERMADMGYPPDMCEEQSENEEDDLWCLNAIEKEFEKRDERANVIGAIDEMRLRGILQETANCPESDMQGGLNEQKQI